MTGPVDAPSCPPPHRRSSLTSATIFHSWWT
jgi:hypothetical protein